MDWKGYVNVSAALDDIPGGSLADTGHSTPDVYGKAIQQYIALQDAVQSTDPQAFDTDEVRTWRCMLAMLALRNFLELPLFWEKVEMPLDDSNQFYRALFHRPVLPGSRKQGTDGMLFSECKWDGKSFYVLKWVPDDKPSKDLMLYSPMTLLYPVADWRNIFEEIARGGDTANEQIRRLFLLDTHCFSPMDALRSPLDEQERQIICFWLQNLRRTLPQVTDNPAQSVILQHLNRYIQDLNVFLTGTQLAGMRMQPLPDPDGALNGFIPALSETVQLGRDWSKNYFTSQLCWFQADQNPFASCSYANCYAIDNSDGWYAFLPVHRDYLDECRSSGFMGNIHMTRIPGGTSANVPDHIRVDMKTAEGSVYKIYKVLQYEDIENVTADLPDVAVRFGNERWNYENWPLISLWPAINENGWRDNYVLIQNESSYKTERLMIGGPDNLTQSGTNIYVTKIAYSPDVIPIDRRLNDKKRVNVGVVTPAVSSSSVAFRQKRAKVAVDFGTSSSRIFVQIDGEESQELSITSHGPLEVTNDQHTGQHGLQKDIILCDYFIAPPHGENRNSPGSGMIFSVYRRSYSSEPKTVNPILDGTIYQPHPDEDIHQLVADENKYFMADLKWNMSQSKAYYEAFIKQLCFLVTVDLYRNDKVGKIIWHYALPLSMKETDRDTVQDFWEKKLTAYLKEASGNQVEHTVCPYISESVAASCYFLWDHKIPVQAEKGYLVVDIGGGSTDVALWQSNSSSPNDNPQYDMKWHTSVKVAGQKMFTQWIGKREYLEHLREAVKQGHDRYGNSQDGSEYPYLQTLAAELMNQQVNPAWKNSLIDQLLSNYGKVLCETFSQAYRKTGSDSDFDDFDDKPRVSWATELCGKITQGLALLMFSMGCQVGRLMRDGIFQIQEKHGYFTIALGGRGSNILDWIPYRTDPKEAEQKLIQMFCDGVSVTYGVHLGKENSTKPLSVETVRILRSNDPKCEVARGLLAGGSKLMDGNAVAYPDERTDLPPRYYVDAANSFRDSFQTIFPDLRLDAFDPHALVNWADRVTRDGVQHNQILNMLMRVIYGYLAEEVEQTPETYR